MPYDPDVIFKALRPVPDFDGNPNVLTRFIKICDQLVSCYMSAEAGNELGNLCLLNGILNKITGPAATIINSNGVPDNWLGIRESLINNFADQRDETALYNDLSLATQGHRTTQEFYDHCQTLFSTIMTYVSLHETIATTIESKRLLYRKLSMQAFVRGLQEPLGSRIRCMRPSTIEQALQFVQEEVNILYLQQRNNEIHPRAQHQQRTQPLTQMPPAPRHGYQPPMMLAPISQRPTFMAPQPFKFSPPQNQFKFNAGPQNQPQYRMPTRTQQMFSAPPPNYNARSNAFRIQPRNQPQNFTPKPMSGIQHFTPRALPPTGLTGHDWSKHGNPPPTNYFRSREMNFNECTNDGYDYHYEPDFNYCPDYNEYPTYAYEYVDHENYGPETAQVYEHYNVHDTVEEPQPSTSQDFFFQKASISDKPK